MGVGTCSRRTWASPSHHFWDFLVGDLPRSTTSHPASAAERASFCTRESPLTPLSTSMTIFPRELRSGPAAELSIAMAGRLSCLEYDGPATVGRVEQRCRHLDGSQPLPQRADVGGLALHSVA